MKFYIFLLFFAFSIANDTDKQLLETESNPDTQNLADESFHDTKKTSLLLSLSPRCRHILTILNNQRRVAKNMDSHAIKSIEKSNGKIVATLVKEHINNAENALLSKISGDARHVRLKLTEWLNSTLKLRELLLSTKLKDTALHFTEIMANIARLVVELILCIRN